MNKREQRELLGKLQKNLQERDTFFHPDELYLLWFRYLEVARRSSDCEILAALQRSKRYYAAWDRAARRHPGGWLGDLDVGFFTEPRVTLGWGSTRVLYPDSLIIQVPLNKSYSDLAKDLKDVFQAEYLRRQLDGEAPWTRKAAAKYAPTSFGLDLEYYRHVLLTYEAEKQASSKCGHSLQGQQLALAIAEYFASQKEKLPPELKYDATNEFERRRVLRNIHRYLDKAEKVIRNVAEGKFPGPPRRS